MYFLYKSRGDFDVWPELCDIYMKFKTEIDRHIHKQCLLLILTFKNCRFI